MSIDLLKFTRINIGGTILAIMVSVYTIKINRFNVMCVMDVSRGVYYIELLEITSIEKYCAGK